MRPLPTVRPSWTRINALNAADATVCAEFTACTYDGGALFALDYWNDPGNLTFDYFHPSITGQALIAQATWPVSPFAPPTASDESASTSQNTPVDVTLQGSSNGQCELTFTIVSGPAHGSLGTPTAHTCSSGSPNTDTETVTYTPTTGYSGPDSFTYKVNDGTSDSNTATVSITVVNAPPTASDESASTSQNTPVDVTLQGSSTSQCELTFTIVSGPAHGSLGTPTAHTCSSGSPNTDTETVTYTPTTGYSGPDTFTYKVNDGTSDSNTATVSITVNPATGYAGAVLADSPAAYYRLDESSGTTVFDGSSHGLDGSYSGSPTLNQPGIAAGDTAVSFNGSSQYAQVPYNAALNGSSFAVEAWAKVSGGAGTYRSLVTSRDIGGSGRAGYILYAASNNHWQFWLGTGSGWYILYGPAVTLNTWTDIAASYDGTTAKLYINGSLAASGTPTSYVPNPASPLRIGAGTTEGPAALYLPGSIDETAIYPTALTPTRIQTHYQTAIPPETTIDSGPSGTTSSTSATLSFHADQSGSTFECQLDGGGYSTCSSPTGYNSLADGSHTFQVRATNSAGTSDPTPASRSWTIDTGLTTYRSVVLADSPAGYYRLDETSGTTMADSSGHGLDGSYLGGPTLNQPGIANGNPAASFDGSSQYGQVTYNSTLNTPQFTVEAWAKVSGGAGTYRSLVTSRDIGGSGRAGYILYAASNNHWQFWLGTGSGWYILYGPAVTLNTWTDIAASYDGTTAKLYINGSLAASGTTTSYVPNPASPLRIGAGTTEGPAALYLPGSIDETAIYPTALTPTRIQTHYQTAIPPETTIDSGPSGTTSSTSATLSFHADQSGSTFECQLDGGGYSTCSSPTGYNSLADGSHTFQVRATNSAGTSDPTPASRSWTIDTGLTTYRSVVLADSPAGYYRLDETSGTTMADSSGHGLDGSYLGGPTLNQPGIANGNPAASFDGSSQYGQVTYNSTLNTPQFTVEAWAKVSGGAGTYRSLVTSRDIGGSGRAGYILYAASNNHWQFWLGTGSGWYILYGPAVTLNTWTDIAASYDGTTAKLYINGSLAASGTTTSYVPNPASPLRIGAGTTEGPAALYLPGSIDETAIYPTALTPTRIQTHFASATP